MCEPQGCDHIREQAGPSAWQLALSSSGFVFDEAGELAGKRGRTYALKPSFWVYDGEASTRAIDFCARTKHAKQTRERWVSRQMSEAGQRDVGAPRGRACDHTQTGSSTYEHTDLKRVLPYLWISLAASVQGRGKVCWSREVVVVRSQFGSRGHARSGWFGVPKRGEASSSSSLP